MTFTSSIYDLDSFEFDRELILMTFRLAPLTFKLELTILI